MESAPALEVWPKNSNLTILAPLRAHWALRPNCWYIVLGRPLGPPRNLFHCNRFDTILQPFSMLVPHQRLKMAVFSLSILPFICNYFLHIPVYPQIFIVFFPFLPGFAIYFCRKKLRFASANLSSALSPLAFTYSVILLLRFIYHFDSFIPSAKVPIPRGGAKRLIYLAAPNLCCLSAFYVCGPGILYGEVVIFLTIYLCMYHKYLEDICF